MRIIENNRSFQRKNGGQEPKNAGQVLSAYNRNVHFRQSRFDAEYHALIRNERAGSLLGKDKNGKKNGAYDSDCSDWTEKRLGELIKDGVKTNGWPYPDRKYNGLPEEERLQYRTLHYQDGFIGHTVTRNDMEQIAMLMPHIVRKLCHTKEPLTYTWKDIDNLLKLIFSTRTIKGPSGKADDYYLQIVGLRCRLPKSCAWASMTEEAALKVEDIVLHGILPAQDDSEGWEKFLLQIEDILRHYTFLGEHSESMGTLQNILGWLRVCMNTPTLEQKGKLACGTELETLCRNFIIRG